MKLTSEMILLNQIAATKEEAIRLAGQLLVQNGCVASDYIESMLKRDQLVSTFMGNFVAIPHGTDEGKRYVKKTGISVVQIPAGVDFATDDSEEKLAMIVFGIAGVGDEHLDVLSKIALFCSEVDNVVRLASAQSAVEVIEMLEEAEE